MILLGSTLRYVALIDVSLFIQITLTKESASNLL